MLLSRSCLCLLERTSKPNSLRPLSRSRPLRDQLGSSGETSVRGLVAAAEDVPGEALPGDVPSVAGAMADVAGAAADPAPDERSMELLIACWRYDGWRMAEAPKSVRNTTGADLEAALGHALVQQSSVA